MSFTAAVITVSDKGSRGERIDTSGPACAAMLTAAGYDVVFQTIVPDERELIARQLIECADRRGVSLIITTGGTGFSPRDVTPEATLSVLERLTPGIPEAMRAASMRITPKGCLSRAVAGIRGGSLIVNLPGSEKAARENLSAVLDAIGHGLEMLASSGSAECAAPVERSLPPSTEQLLAEAKSTPGWEGVGMYLIHCGVVRQSARAQVRGGQETPPVTGMRVRCDREKAEKAVREVRAMPGINYVRVWTAEGELRVGDDLMRAIVGGDIRPNVTAALDRLLGIIKNECISETELF